MDDIDRTFLKLKRNPLNDVLNELLLSGKVEVRVDPETFMPISRIKKEELDQAGWTEDEVTAHLEASGHVVVLHRNIYRITFYQQ